MKSSSRLIYIVGFITVVGAGAFLYAQRTSSSVSSAPISVHSTLPTPSPTPTALTKPTPSPEGLTYLNAQIGISFQYPIGYYVIEVPQYNRLEVQNVNHQLSGIPDASFRLIELQYGSFTEDENVTKAQKGVTVNQITAHGTVVRYYTYPNPNNPSYTVAEGFWTGKTNFSARILWDRTANTPVEGAQEADEVALMKKLLPTVGVGK